MTRKTPLNCFDSHTLEIKIDKCKKRNIGTPNWGSLQETCLQHFCQFSRHKNLMNYFAPLYLPPFEEEEKKTSLIDTVAPSPTVSFWGVSNEMRQSKRENFWFCVGLGCITKKNIVGSSYRMQNYFTLRQPKHDGESNGSKCPHTIKLSKGYLLI